MLFEPLGIEHGVVNEGAHRAKNDVIECLAMARNYQNTVLGRGRLTVDSFPTEEELQDRLTKRHSSAPDGKLGSRLEGEVL
jgi:hypothetical protein